jgi:hypothetical protein
VAKYLNLQALLGGGQDWSAVPQPQINTQPAGNAGWGALPQAQVNNQPGGGGWSPVSLAGLLGGGGGGLLAQLFGGGGWTPAGSGTGNTPMQSLVAALRSPQQNYSNYQEPELPPINIGNEYPTEPPTATPPPGTSGSGGDYNPGPSVQINPTGYQQPNQPLELINDLGYSPSYPYGSSGSGVPTQRGAGLAGGVAGGILGNLLLPGLGGILGGKLGAAGAGMLARLLQSHGMQPPGNNAGGNAGGNNAGGGGGFNLPNMPQGYDPFGGLPEGFQENNRFGMGAPTFTGPGSTGPQWGGGSIFNANLPGGRATPLPGALFNIGAGGGELGDFGAKLALHSTGFRNAVQRMGYANLADFMRRTGFHLGARGLGGGQGVGGAGRPMTQNT